VPNGKGRRTKQTTEAGLWELAGENDMIQELRHYY